MTMEVQAMSASKVSTLVLPQSEELLAVTEIHFNGPSAGIVIEDISNIHIGFSAEEGMPLFLLHRTKAIRDIS